MHHHNICPRGTSEKEATGNSNTRSYEHLEYSSKSYLEASAFAVDFLQALREHLGQPDANREQVTDPLDQSAYRAESSGASSAAYRPSPSTTEFFAHRESLVSNTSSLTEDTWPSSNTDNSFYDEDYGVSPALTPESDDFPYLDSINPFTPPPGATFAPIHASPAYSNKSGFYQSQAECPIVRRYGHFQRPIYVDNLPPTFYNSATNTIVLHQEDFSGDTVYDTVYLACLSRRLRTWTGRVKKYKITTNPLSFIDNWSLADLPPLPPPLPLNCRAPDNAPSPHTTESLGITDNSSLYTRYTTPFIVLYLTYLAFFVWFYIRRFRTLFRIDCRNMYHHVFGPLATTTYVPNSGRPSLAFQDLNDAILGSGVVGGGLIDPPDDSPPTDIAPLSFQERTAQADRFHRRRNAPTIQNARVKAYLSSPQCNKPFLDPDAIDDEVKRQRSLPRPWYQQVVDFVLYPLGFIFAPVSTICLYLGSCVFVLLTKCDYFHGYVTAQCKTMWVCAKMLKAMKAAHQELEHWTRSIQNFVMDRCSFEDKVRIIEIKSMIHIAYHVYNGNRDSALEWASNIFFTRREIITWLTTLPYETAMKCIREPKAEVIIQGNSRLVNPRTFLQYVNIYKENPVDPDYSGIEEDVQPNAGIADLLFGVPILQMGDLNVNHLKEANTQFTFVKLQMDSITKKLDFGKALISVIGRTFFSIDPFDPEYQQMISQMINVIEYTRLSKIRESDLINDRVFMKELKVRFDESCLIYNDPSINTAPRFIQTSYRKAHEDLEVMAKVAVNQLHGNTSRIEPLSVLMTGPPSSGKSALTKFAMKALCRLDGKSFDHSMAFSRAAGSDYWDGYNMQPFVCVDDLWKIADLQKRIVQTAEVVDMINTSSVSLNMAALSGKGVTYFNSKYVFFSTNIANKGINTAVLQVGATDPEAIKRRFHLVIHREIKLEGDLMDAMWRIDKCVFPEVVWSEANPIFLNSIDVVHLMKRVRDKQIDDSCRYELTDGQIDELFNVNANPVPSSAGLYAKIMSLGLYEWKDSASYTYFVLAASMVILVAMAYPIYNAIFSTLTTNSGKEMGFDSAMSFTDGEHAEWTKSLRRKKVEEETGEDLGVSNQTGMKKLRFNMNSAKMNYEESLVKRVSKGLIYISCRVTDPTGREISYSGCVASHMQDRWILTCAHWYLDHLVNIKVGCVAKLYVATHDRDYELPFPVGDEVMTCEDADAVFIRLDTKVQLLPSLIRDLCPPGKEYKIMPGTALDICTMGEDGHVRFTDVTTVSYAGGISYPGPKARFVVSQPIAYYYPSKGGHSGSLLITHNSSGKAIIVGMHVGNRPNSFGKIISFAVPLFSDVIRSFLDSPTVEAPIVTNAGAPEFPLTILERVPQNQRHIINRHHKYHRSDMYGWDGEATFVPVDMRPGELNGVLVDPLHLALAKIRQQPFPSFIMPERIFDHVLNLYPPINDSRVLTMAEAINGIPEKHIPGIRLDTSCGYPFSLHKRAPGKHHYIKRGDDGVLRPTPDFQKVLDECHNGLKAGKKMDVLWADNLKAETRHVDKVAAKKVRLISACPIDFLVMVRMYFGDFVSYTHRTPATKPFSVGINPHSFDWKMLYDRLKTKSASVVSGDFANFDGSIPDFMSDVFVDFVNRWYDDCDENKAIRRLLVSSITNAKHIVHDIIYQACGGEPSGEPMTSARDSVIVYFELSYILLEVLRISEDQFEAAIYGDDTLLSVNVKGLRCKHLSPHFKNLFGMDFTHWSKTDHDVDDTLDTVSYLGRSFRDGQHAPLERKVITEMVYWRRGGDNRKNDILLSTIQCFMVEMSHYPRDVYNKEVRELMRHMRKGKANKLVDSVQLRTWEHFYQRKFAPLPSDAPLNLYYGEERWGHFDNETYVEDFVVNSGKPDPNRVRHSDNQPSDAAPDRMMEPSSTQQTQLGEFMDVNPVFSSGVDAAMTQPIHDEVNLQGYDFDGSLNRIYHLLTAVWTSAMAVDTVLATFLFPDELFTQPYISEKVTDYRYFHADTRVTVRVKSNEFFYGTIMIDFVPNINDTNYLPNDVYACSGGNHVLVFAGAATTEIFDIPFIYPYRYLDITNYTAGDLGRVRVRVLNPLRDIQGNAVSVDVVVTAQFMNANVYLPDLTSGPAVARMLSYVNDNATEPRRHFNYRSAAATQHIDDFVVNSGKGEAYRKSTRGVISDSLISNSVLKATISIGKSVANYVNTFSAAGTAVNAALGMSGLSKPVTLATTDVIKVNPTSDFTYGKGISTSLKMSMDPECAITTDPNVAGVSHDEMDILTIVGTPALSRILTVNKGDPAVIVAFNGPDTGTTHKTYVDWLPANFVHWSGSIKIMVYINAATFHDITLVFWLADNYAATDDWQSCYHKMVEVKGPTVVSFTLPYTSPSVHTRSGVQSVPLNVRQLSWSEPFNVVDTPIDLNVYKAAASDFRVYTHKYMTYTPNCNPRADFAQDFPMFAPGSRTYHAGRYMNGEDFVTVREVIHRPLSEGPATGATYVWNGAPITSWKGMSLWGLLFYFWRGGISTKFVTRDSRLMRALVLQNNSSNLVGTYYSTPTNPMIEVTVPYYANRLYLPTGANSANILRGSNDNTLWLFRSGADDFSFHFLRLPPKGTWTEGASTDSQAFVAWLGAGTQTTVLVSP